MERSSVLPYSRIGFDRPPIWTVALAATVSYVALVANDVSIGPAPLKLFLVGGTLAAWWVSLGVKPSLARYRFAKPVLLLGIATPLIWTAVAAFNAVVGDSVARHELSFTIQNASRFVYVLLYFPLIDLARDFDRRALQRVWLIPVAAICLVTAVIWIDHLLTGDRFGTTSILVFTGAIGAAPEGFRVFVGNQIFLVPAFGLFLAQLATSGWSTGRVLGLAALTATAFLSHTRGIWLGLSILCAAMLVVLILRSAQPRLRPALTLAAASGAVAVMVASALVLGGAIGRPGFLSDASAGVRVEQAAPLWHGFEAHPIFGSGLGAALDSGFQRGGDYPWSFEDTYLQILFQMGIVGLAIMLLLPVMVIWTAGREVVQSPRIRAGPLAAIGGLIGIFVCTSTNPLLLSSFGMLSIVMAVTFAEPTATPDRE